jgi:predicted component of type VI protein secretion system
LGRIARKANAPVLGEADLSLLGASEWQAFRRLPEAQWIGLALPRVLLRAPYGKDTEPIDRFPFEEIKGQPEAKQMLFGNPAIVCAMLLGQSFEQEGWRLRPGAVRDVSGLPIYVYDDEGESRTFPCAEIELKESTAEELLDEGIMPVAAMRNSDSVRVIRFQSAADPVTGLSGRWA